MTTNEGDRKPPIDLVDDRKDEITISPPPRKGKRKSMVWDHFKVLSSYPDHDPHAKCVHCGVVYACHTKRNGTGTLRVHLESYCKKYPYRISKDQDPKQPKLFFKKTEKGGENQTNLGYGSFSLENARKLIARMLIIDGLPFSHVENQGFREFIDGTIRLIEPRFITPSRHAIRRDCLAIYEVEKDKLQKRFQNAKFRVSLTIDTWTSAQNINYMVLAAHFIDDDWNVHKKILNFCQIENHKGETIGKKVERCLKQWGISKIMTMTVDNASSNDTVIAYLIKHYSSAILLEGKFLHVQCCAHSINLIVSDGLKEVNQSVGRIRNVVRYVRSSPSRLATFKKCIVEENISSKSLVCLDVPTRWNSTYLMLDSAVKFEKAFDRLEDFDPSYKEEDRPKGDDWSIARTFIKFLKVFYDVTLRISRSSYVTANVVFCEMTNIYGCINACVSRVDDFSLCDISLKMQSKYDKYWGIPEEVNPLIYIAAVLDPRYKLDYLDYCFAEVYDNGVATSITKKVELDLRRLYTTYSSEFASTSSDVDLNTCSSPPLKDLNEFSFSDSLKNRYKGKKKLSRNSESEIDLYLLEPQASETDSQKFDIIQWWRHNASRYPILSNIARDILAMPVSIVALESAFSTGCRVIDPFCTSLAPSTIEALICAQNWLCGSDNSMLNLLDELKEICSIEKEFTHQESLEGNTSIHEE